jgi:ribosomal protein S18 acetylase RimI-like enzyme
VWVHTCTLDHPSALGFYRRHGFTAIGRAVETFTDPRVLGVLPMDAAPQIPLLTPRS